MSSMADENRFAALEKQVLVNTEQMRLVIAGLAAVTERQEFLEAAMSMGAANNAVLEGDEVEPAPRAIRNGKAKTR
jgi:hypothetical protein